MGARAKEQINREGLIDLILTDDDIMKRGIPSHELFVVLNAGEYFGPLSKDDLLAINQMDPFFFEKFRIKTYNPQESNQLGHWINFYEHPFFQRRKPELVNDGLSHDQALSTEFHVLKNGQTLGPYTYEELKREVLQKQIHYTDLFRADSDEEWEKIYKIPGFDRRAKLPGHDEQDEELPPAPTVDLIKKSAEEVTQILDTNKLLEEQNKNSLANLMNLGKTRAKKLLVVSSNQFTNNSNVQFIRKNRKAFVAGLTFITLAVLAVNFYPEIKKNIPNVKKPFAKKSKSVQKRKNVTSAKNVKKTVTAPKTQLRRTPIVDQPTNDYNNEPVRRKSRAEKRLENRQREREELGERRDDPVVYDDYVPSDEYYYDDDPAEIEGEAIRTPRKPASAARELPAPNEEDYYVDEEDDSYYDGPDEEGEIFDDEYDSADEEYY